VPRTLAALLADRSAADSYLHLDNPSATSRVRAIANVLWPWGRSARGLRSFNPYAGSLEGDTDLLRQHWHSPVEFIDLGQWNDVVRSDLHERLRVSAELILRTPTASKGVLRAALIDLQTTPIEVGPLWCYPEVLGIQDRGTSIEARVRLQETW
jgi:hypothetical protein